MNKIWSIVLESDTGSVVHMCIEAQYCCDAINIAFAKHGKVFPYLKSVKSND